MVTYRKLNEYQEKFFDGIIIILYILIISSILGIFNNASSYLNVIDYYFRIYICLFLIWRFNPFRSIDIFTNLDRKIAFNSGMFILTTTILKNYIHDIKSRLEHTSYFTNIKNSIDNVIKPNLY